MVGLTIPKGLTIDPIRSGIGWLTDAYYKATPLQYQIAPRVGSVGGMTPSPDPLRTDQWGRYRSPTGEQSYQRGKALRLAQAESPGTRAQDIFKQQLKVDKPVGYGTRSRLARALVGSGGRVLTGALSSPYGLAAQAAFYPSEISLDPDEDTELMQSLQSGIKARQDELGKIEAHIPKRRGVTPDLEERIGYNEADTLRQHSEIVRDSRSSPLQRSQSAQTLIESVANRPYIAPFISGGEEVKSSTEKVLDTFLPSAFNIKNIDQVKSEILGNIDFDLEMETEITPQTPEQYLQSIEDAGATGEQIVPRRLFTRKPLRYYMPEYLESTGPEPDVAPSIWYTGEIPEEGPGILDRLRQAIIPDVGAATAPVDVSDITRPINPSVSRTVEGLPEELEALVQLIQSDPDVSKKYIGPRDATVTTPLLANLMSATPVETFEDIPFFQPGAETAWTPPAPVVPDITETLADFSDIQSAQEKAAQKAQDKIDRGLKHAANVRRKDEKKARLAEARDKKAEAKKIAAEDKARKAEEKRISDKQAAEEKQRRANEVKFANMLKQANETHRAYLSRKREEEARRKRLGYGVGAMYT
jgi:hypothetical protein